MSLKLAIFFKSTIPFDAFEAGKVSAGRRIPGVGLGPSWQPTGRMKLN